MNLESIVQRCEDLCRDLDFNYVKEWKKKTGSKAVAFMPIYVPRELIHAAGMLPVGIMGGGDDLEIIRGDAYFQSYICRIPRSTIEMGLGGKLDCMDGFLFPAICDVIRNLSGMWKLMFKEKYAKYLDFPQNLGKSGKNFYVQELQRLKADFEVISGKKITDGSLRRSNELYNENRAVLRELYDLRSQYPHQILTYEAYLILRASNILEVSEHTRLVRDYMTLAMKKSRPNRDYVRVIVSGAFCEQPPLNLIRALEGSGCYIVDDDWILGARYVLSAISSSGDPLMALADSYMDNTVATGSRHEDASVKGEYLIELVRERRADGVVFAAPSFCDPALLERPMLQDALTARNIPHTGFKYAENTGQIQTIKEETGTFADSIKLWGAE